MYLLHYTHPSIVSHIELFTSMSVSLLLCMHHQTNPVWRLAATLAISRLGPTTSPTQPSEPRFTLTLRPAPLQRGPTIFSSPDPRTLICRTHHAQSRTRTCNMKHTDTQPYTPHTRYKYCQKERRVHDPSTYSPPPPPPPPADANAKTIQTPFCPP
jgi:hypothetical protein